MTLLQLLLSLSFAWAAPVAPITIQLETDPGSLNPVKLESLLGTGVVSNLVETLMKNDVSGHLVKGLAESYEISQNGRRYTFKIRPDAKWSDGKPVTVDDCVFGLVNALDPKSVADDAELLFQIKNAHDYFSGKAAASSVGVSEKNGRLVIDLEKPDSVLLSVLAAPITAPRRREFGQKYSDAQPTSGRYFLKRAIPEREINLEPNPYNKLDGQLPIKFMILSEQTSAENLFLAGKLDVFSDVNINDMDKYKRDGRLYQKQITYVRYIAFNLKSPPLDQPIWRKAIAGAIDREAIARVLHYAMRPTTSYIPEGLDGFKEFKSLDFAKEQKAVREMKNKPRIKIGYMTGAQPELIAQRIQNDLQRKLGLDVELNGMEQKMYFSLLEHNPLPIYYMGMGAVFADPINFLRDFTLNPALGTDHANYDSPEFAGLVAKIRSLPLGRKRSELILKAHKILVEQDTIVVPLVQRMLIYAVSPKIKNFMVNPFSVPQLAEIRRQD